jgi:P-type Cu+ transporter
VVRKIPVMNGRRGGIADSLPPHPGPLPRGEGEEYGRRNLDRVSTPVRAYAVPSPRGEGRGEGKGTVRSSNVSFQSNEERIALSQIQTGDHLILRNGELIPADARLVAGPAVIDYSFVTGESEPVEKQAGDYIYAGGRQIGGAIEVETVKAVSQSYLTSLWNQEAFRKEDRDSLDNLTNEYSQRFTKLVLAIALGAAAYWAVFNPSLALKSFTAVLIVACPCALALAAPFTLGTAHRWLAKWNAFLKSAGIIERLARVDTIVFDKTGTLTAAGSGLVKFHGTPLNETEERALFSMTRHSTHPLAVRLGHAIAGNYFPDTVRSFLETAVCGMEGQVNRQEIWMGSAAWLQSRGLKPASATAESGSVIHVAINGQYRGCYVLQNALRPETDRLIQNLSTHYELALLSGDNERERARFAEIFGAQAHLQFNQSPLNKLGFIRELQQRGKTVMMVGDGLNDAGALKQSDVGVAVVEDMSAFSPASDMILSARLVPRIDAILRFAKSAVRVIKASFLVSAAYNVIGLALAVQGLLSPVVCAILMPVSSITVVGFACLMTGWMAKREGIGTPMEEIR